MLKLQIKLLYGNFLYFSILRRATLKATIPAIKREIVLGSGTGTLLTDCAKACPPATINVNENRLRFKIIDFIVIAAYKCETIHVAKLKASIQPFYKNLLNSNN